MHVETQLVVPPELYAATVQIRARSFAIRTTSYMIMNIHTHVVSVIFFSVILIIDGCTARVEVFSV